MTEIMRSSSNSSDTSLRYEETVNRSALPSNFRMTVVSGEKTNPKGPEMDIVGRGKSQDRSGVANHGRCIDLCMTKDLSMVAKIWEDVENSQNWYGSKTLRPRAGTLQSAINGRDLTSGLRT